VNPNPQSPFITIVIAVFAVAAMYHVLRSTRWQPLPPNERPTADVLQSPEVAETFQKRRRVFLRCMAMVLAMFVYTYILLAFAQRHGSTLLGLPLQAHFIGAFVVMGISIFAGSKIYRCPVCSQAPWAQSAGRRGVDLDPAECPICGARFR
jgi:hypothetical protein